MNRLSSAKQANSTGWHLHPQLAEDTHPVAHFGLSDLQLMDDANHPWLIRCRAWKPRWNGSISTKPASRTHARNRKASHALQVVFKPQKLNVAALGNMVPQLHVHVIARFDEDIAWPRPVWGMATAQPYSTEELVSRIERLRAALA